MREQDCCASVTAIMRAIPRLAYSAVIAAIAVSVVAAGPASAEVQEIAARQRAEKKFFSDAEIIEGFLKTAFGAEYHLAGLTASANM